MTAATGPSLEQFLAYARQQEQALLAGELALALEVMERRAKLAGLGPPVLPPDPEAARAVLEQIAEADRAAGRALHRLGEAARAELIRVEMERRCMQGYGGNHRGSGNHVDGRH
ncbi:MAG TPA: hypothetical protein DCM14_07575 [Clostridiales bacterium UBA8153]|nr:hypothetical protein [Clostridiales bacterium UBA8153]